MTCDIIILLSEIRRLLDEVAVARGLTDKGISWERQHLSKAVATLWANLLTELYEHPYIFGSPSSVLFVSRLSWSFFFRHKGTIIPVCSRPVCGGKAEISSVHNNECPSCYVSPSAIGK